MGRFTRHVAIPFVATAIFFAVALTPVQVLGCRGRGLAAFIVALLSGLAAIGAAFIGLRGRLRGDPASTWWVLTALVLAIPVVAMIAMM